MPTVSVLLHSLISHAWPLLFPKRCIAAVGCAALTLRLQDFPMHPVESRVSRGTGVSGGSESKVAKTPPPTTAAYFRFELRSMARLKIGRRGTPLSRVHLAPPSVVLKSPNCVAA